jgi:hypothetical protein
VSRPFADTPAFAEQEEANVAVLKAQLEYLYGELADSWEQAAGV